MTSDSNPEACVECLRRARLLAHLAPYIEKIATGAPGRRSPEERLRAELAEADCWACCRHDPLFPVGLQDAADSPWALIGRGDPALLAALVPDGAVTVVGARRASTYGREVARRAP